jgi:mannose-6-phosphate isomerase
MCLHGDCQLRIKSTGDTLFLPHGHSTLIPAVIADYDIIPLTDSTKVLETFINNMDTSLTGKLTRFLHIGG